MTSFSDRTFGVELEMRTIRTDRTHLSDSEIANALTAVPTDIRTHRVVRTGGYTHSNGTSWDVKTDSSAGWEVAGPALRFDANGECAELNACVAALQSLRPSVDRTCGYHVHVSVSDFTWTDLQKLLAAWTKYEPFFYDLTPTTRHTNHYCAPTGRARFSDRLNVVGAIPMMAAATSERTFNSYERRTPRGSLNLAHWWQSGRIEFRLAAGTVNPVKVAQWAKLLVGFVSSFKDAQLMAEQNIPVGVNFALSNAPVARTSIPSTRSVLATFGLVGALAPAGSESLVRWVEARRSHFGHEPIATTVATVTLTDSQQALVRAMARGAMNATVQATTLPAYVVPASSQRASLAARNAEIFRLVSEEGLTRQQIAARLGLSPEVVRRIIIAQRTARASSNRSA